MRRCPGCQKEFKPTRTNQEYHSKSCYNKQYNRRRDPLTVILSARGFRKRNRERLNEEGKVYYQEHREEMIEKAKLNRFKRKQRAMLRSYYESI